MYTFWPKSCSVVARYKNHEKSFYSNDNTAKCLYILLV